MKKLFSCGLMTVDFQVNVLFCGETDSETEMLFWEIQQSSNYTDVDFTETGLTLTLIP